MEEIIGKIGKYLQDLIAAPQNLILRAMNKPSKIKWLWFGVTDRCNSRCVHCNIWKTPNINIKDLITLEEIEKTFKDPLLKDLEAVYLSGGEVVLREDNKELIKIINKYVPRANIALSTNGLLPDKVIETTKFAVENKIPFSVGISLDGIGEKHDSIRGVKGNFEKIDYLLKELVKIREKYGCDNLALTLGLTLSDFALPNVKEVEEYAKKLNIELLVQWYNNSSYYENTKDNIATKNDEITKVVKSLSHSPLNEMWLKSLKTGKLTKFPCFAMNTFCVLQWDGSISPCLSLWGTRVGSVKNNTFSEIWYGQKAMDVRKAIKNCEGCLNSWGVGWSFTSGFFPNLFFKLKHPVILFKKLTGNYYPKD